MIRPKWPRQATLHQWRGVSSKPSSRRGRPSHHAPSGRPRPEWPQLKRRAPSRVLLDDESDEALSAELRRATPTKGDFVAKRGISRSLGRKEVDWTALTARASEIREAKEGSARGRGHGAEKSDIGAGGEAEHDVPASGSDTKNMLLVRGVSNNLNASDFYRLAPYSLSSWESSIKKVQQQRDPKTLEPLGCYQVSFSTADAATSYLTNLIHLQRLARHKISSTNGLWQATAPAYLLNSSDRADIARDVDRLTIASPSQADLPITRARTSVRYPWAQKLADLVEPLGYGPRPPTVLVDVSLRAEDLQHYIMQDGWQRDLAWSVSDPVVVDMRKTRNRFVIACETEWEARRFHRHWNQQTVSRTLENYATHRHVLSVSIIDW